MTDPHPDIGPPKAVPQHIWNEAIEVGNGLWQSARPVSETIVRSWATPILIPFLSADGRVRTDMEIAAWFSGLMLAVDHLEVGAFTRQTQKDAMAAIHFFPKPADIYDVLVGPAVQIRTLFSTIKRIVGLPILGANVVPIRAGDAA